MNKEKKVLRFYEIRLFELYLNSLRSSKNTTSAYRSDLVQYQDYMIDSLKINNVKDISREDILKYIAHLKRKELSKKTISYQPSSVSILRLHFLFTKGSPCVSGTVTGL